MFKNKCAPVVLLMLSLNFSSIHASALELNAIFQDHMVLQRHKPVQVDGWAKPHQKLTITHRNSIKKTVTDHKGRWHVILPAHKASGPFSMSISDQTNTVTIKDIYYGDVWLASGQSNMEYKLRWDIDNWQEEAKDSDYPLIRYFKLPRSFSSKPETHIPTTRWVIANPKTSPDFSAIAWFFAKKVHQNQNVPIGIIDSTWGGTPAEAWSPRETLLQNPDYRAQARKVDPNSTALSEAYQREKKRIKEKEMMVRKDVTDLARTITHTHKTFQAWSTDAFPSDKKYKDVLWLKKEISVPGEYLKDSGFVTMSLGKRPRFIKVFLNGHLVDEKNGRQKKRDFDIAIDAFKTGKNTLVVRALSTWDNPIIFGLKNKMHLDFFGRKISLEGSWLWSNKIESPLPMPLGNWMKPTVLYNAMIAPLTPYALKGVIWYQGESNTGKPALYSRLFKDLITSWREAWRHEDLPFLFVQLASFRPQSIAPQESRWAELREAQTTALELKNTGMVVAIDAGDADDIHPRNKQVISERLWQSARAVAYQKRTLSSGPTLKKMYAKGDKLMLLFNHTGKGLVSRGTLVGFEVAGPDGKYYKAEATISKRNTIVISSEGVRQPVSVRYGWADNSPANLYNDKGLPAVPFRRE